jgi:hypothetical protein
MPEVIRMLPVPPHGKHFGESFRIPANEAAALGAGDEAAIRAEAKRRHSERTVLGCLEQSAGLGIANAEPSRRLGHGQPRAVGAEAKCLDSLLRQAVRE